MLLWGSNASASSTRPPPDLIAKNPTRLAAIRAKVVAMGLPVRRLPPYTALPWRVLRAPSLTQSGHWKPTDASRMQSGQIGFSQRWHRIQVSLSGCR